MSVELFSLAYFSRTSLAADDGAAAAEIERILAVATRNNKMNGVTGALLYSRGCFAQVLEGPLAAVEAIFEKIELDPRHRDVTLLHFKPIEARSFERWTMVYAGCPNAAARRLRLDYLLDRPDTIKGDQAGQDLVAVLKDLIAKHEIHEL